MTKTRDVELDRIAEKIAKGGGINFVSKIIGTALGFLIVLVLARFLGAESLGLYFLGVALLTILGIPSRLGLHMGSLRFVSIFNSEKNNEKVKGVIIISLLLSFQSGLIIAIIIYSLNGFIANYFFHYDDMAIVIRLFSFAIPFYSSFLVAAFIALGFKAAKYHAYTSNLLNPIINLALIVLFILIFGLSLNEAILAKILSYVFIFFIAIFYIYKIFPALFDRRIKPIYGTSKLLRFSLPLVGTNFLQYLIMWTDIFLIGFFLTPSDVGIYRTSVEVSLFLILIFGAFNTIFAPFAADLYHKKEINKLDGIFKITTKWIFYLTIPIFIIIISLSQEILKIFGPEFILGSNVLILLAVSQFINASTGNVAMALIMSGREKLELLNTLLIASINIILNILLIPIYGIFGAAISTGFSIISINLLRLIEVYFILKIFPYDKKIFKGIVAGFVTFVLIFLLKRYLLNLHYIALIIIISLLTIIIFLSLFKILKFDEEDKLILNIIKSKLKNIFN